ncbi:MAG: SCO family protein [Solirubrobacteraceae bacterium]
MPRILLPFALLLALALSACASTRQPTTTFDGAALPPGLHARAFTLTDQHAESVSLEGSHGRPRLLAFLSASKRGSLLVAQQIRGALDELGASEASRLSVLIVSTDRSVGHAKVERFLQEAGLVGRARFLTGPTDRLQAIWRAYGIVPASGGEAAFLSSTPIILVDRAGVERVGFPVEQLTPEGLAHDLRTLLDR